MKKIVLMAMAACATSAAFAQKMKVTEAENALILQQYDVAKEKIDAALANEKTSNWVKTYIVASRVYSKLAVEGKDDSGVAKGEEFLANAKAMDEAGDEKGKKNKFVKDLQKEYQTFSDNATNFAVKCFNNKNYKGAKESFSSVLWSNSNIAGYQAVADTLIIYNTAIAAMLAEDYATAAENFEKTIEYGYEGPMSVLRRNYCFEQLKDSVNIESNLKAGFEKYPAEKDILTTLIQYYLKAKKNEEALVYLNQAIDKEPSNPQFYFARGCLNEKISVEAAIDDYNKAIDLNPSFFDALYNMAVVHFNQGVEITSQASNERDQKKYEALQAQAMDKFREAVPYMERAAEATTDVNNKKSTYETLKNLYYRVGDNDKYSKVQEILNSL